MKTYTAANEQETRSIAIALAGTLKPSDVIAYRGGMGAGKTTFTRGLAEGLGIDSYEVSSPTFALIQEYRGDNMVLAHFDMYRVEDYDSLYSTGFFDYLDNGYILAIEWSENITEFLPDNAIIVTLSPVGEHTRNITIEGGCL